MGIDNVNIIEEAIEGCLVGRSSIDGCLDATCLSGRIVVDVKVRGFIETVQRRTRARSSEVRVDVGIPDQQNLVPRSAKE